MAKLNPAQLRKVDQQKQTRVTVEGASAAALEEQEKKRQGMIGRRWVAGLAVFSLAVLCFAFIFPEGLMRESNTVTDFNAFTERVMANISNVVGAIANTHTSGNYALIMSRYLAAFVTGAVLGTCGAVYQGAFRNPLASPSTLGVVSGCLLGSVIFYLFLFEGWIQASLTSVSFITDALEDLNFLEYIWVVYGRSICAVLGGFAVVGTALMVSRALGGGALGSIVLVVIGQVFTLVADSVIDTVRYYLEATGEITRATLVQLAEASPFSVIMGFADLFMVCIPLFAGLIVLLALRNRMDVLSFTDEEARTLGVDVGRFRTVVVLLCTAVTGITVGFCGPIGFVGFVAPHIARRLVGSSFRYLLPASLFTGAIFLVVALCVVNQLDIAGGQGVNLVTTSLGCVVFLLIAFRNRGGARAWH
ncbi:MAG: iron ABC transporter permease [Coriobacteriia bacterium]|nr:iron ABC transporter permease [Coriobacteriia bacterium]